MLFKLLVELCPGVPFWRVLSILLVLFTLFILVLRQILLEIELVELLQSVHILGSDSVLQITVLVINNDNLRVKQVITD